MKKTISISRSIRMVPLLFVILFAGATLANSERCPNKDDISPCVCHADPHIEDVVCSNITSEDQLTDILWSQLFTETIPHLVLQNLTFSTLPYLGLYELRVRDLEILDSNISDFSADAVRSQPLHLLRVDRNKLANVPSEALRKVQWKLKILSMSGNVLTKIEHASLNFMHTVENLTLSENKITQVARVSLPPNLQYLWISRNKLKTFTRSLHLTKKLKHLDASNNNLTSMEGQLDGLLSLQTVILDHNHISDISGTFSHLRSVRELSLVGNGIREIGEALVDLEQLTHLNLSRNAITNLSRTVFEKMINLYDLNLSENPLTAFPLCLALRPLKYLGRLNVSNSNLDRLRWDCFDKNTNLESMDLSRNQLSNLGLDFAEKLVFIDISFNNIIFLRWLELAYDIINCTLVLEGNPLMCSGDNWFELRRLEAWGYYFPIGYPTCYRDGVKPLGCLLYKGQLQMNM